MKEAEGKKRNEMKERRATERTCNEINRMEWQERKGMTRTEINGKE